MIEKLNINIVYGSAFIILDHNFKYLTGADCRDLIHQSTIRFLPEPTDLYLGVRTTTINMVPDHIKVLEDTLGKEPSKLYVINNSVEAVFILIKLDSYWRHPLRFSFLTAFLKTVRLENNSIDLFKLDSRYFRNTDVLKLFLSRCFIGTYVPIKGWLDHFRNHTNLNKILSKTPFEKLEPIQINDVTYEMAPGGYKAIHSKNLIHYYNHKGQLHREDGPAKTGIAGVPAKWYINGQRIIKNEH